MESNSVIFTSKTHAKSTEKNKISDNCMEFCLLAILLTCSISPEKCGCIFTESKQAPENSTDGFIYDLIAMYSHFYEDRDPWHSW